MTTSFCEAKLVVLLGHDGPISKLSIGAMMGPIPELPSLMSELLDRF